MGGRRGPPRGEGPRRAFPGILYPRKRGAPHGLAVRPPPPAVSSRPWSVLLFVLVAAPALGFLPKVLREREPLPADRRPTWANLVFVTYDRSPRDFAPIGPGLGLIVRRGTNAMLVAPQDDDMAASAASLWTGHRWDRAELAAVEGEIPWTMASSAQRCGAVTAAFLERPLVGEAKLSGFERVLVEPDLGPERLTALAEELVAANRDRRLVVWLHLADPGEHGERLDAVMQGVGATLLRHGLGWNTVWLAAPLCADGLPETKLWALLPAGMYAGRHGTGRTEGIKIASVMEELMRLPPPDVSRGEKPIGSNVDLVVLLRGGTILSEEDP